MKIIDYELIRLQYAVFFGKEVKVTTSSYPKKSAIWKVLVGLIGLIGLIGLVGLVGLIGLVGFVGLMRLQSGSFRPDLDDSFGAGGIVFPQMNYL